MPGFHPSGSLRNPIFLSARDRKDVPTNMGNVRDNKLFYTDSTVLSGVGVFSSQSQIGQWLVFFGASWGNSWKKIELNPG